MLKQPNPLPRRRPRMQRNRRGAAVVLSIGLIFVLLCFLAFSVDVGYISQSMAEMRTDMGRSSGQISRMARNTSSGSRMRFSSGPP